MALEGSCAAASVRAPALSFAERARGLRFISWSPGTTGPRVIVSKVGSGEAVDEWTPFYAAGFLFSAELSFWSTEPRVPAWSDLEVVLRRLGTVLAACLGAAGIAAIVIIAAGASLGDSLIAEVAGLASAVAALALLGALVRLLR